MQNDTVITRVCDDGIARVTLARADKHNAFDDSMIAELREAFDSLAARDEVRVVILASEGKHFSAGADLNWMRRMAGYDQVRNLQDARLLADMLQALYALPQPTIARVQGAAFGGAVGLASCCDICVAEDSASFCLSEVRIGLIPATISPYVIRAIGERAARRYFTTAERFSAAEAQRLGLVSQVVGAGDLDAAVEALTGAIMENGPHAVRRAKRLLNDVAGRDLSPALIAHTCEEIAQIRVSEEGQEGLDAFLNKRAPNWVRH
ncbi:MAG: enoyl-CoA hydratase/isomerase family protein [Halioglobus sp.]|nr:enoyl-CoA hydratase/isomerase family protein [Halioglobus sp.]